MIQELITRFKQIIDNILKIKLFRVFHSYYMYCRYFLAVPSGRGAPHHRHLYAVKFTPAASLSATNVDISTRAGHHHQQQYRKNTHHNTRSRPVCLSCDVGFTTNVQGRERRDVPGKQNRMDEARDDRLRRQHRERWENQQEDDKDNEEEEEVATAEGNIE
jgi:hypothetical protein